MRTTPFFSEAVQSAQFSAMRYTQKMLIEEVNSVGFQGTYAQLQDFPWATVDICSTKGALGFRV